MERVYLGNFNRWGRYETGGRYDHETVSDDFEITDPEPRFVFAAYKTPNCDGYAAVITPGDGKTVCVAEGSLCSCYGLGGQYDPTPRAVDEVRHMIDAACFGALHTWQDEARAD